MGIDPPQGMRGMRAALIESEKQVVERCDKKLHHGGLIPSREGELPESLITNDRGGLSSSEQDDERSVATKMIVVLPPVSKHKLSQ